MTLAKITFTNAQKWALAHNRPRGPDSVVMDLADYYDHDERELNHMIHSSGPERIYMADPQDGGDNTDQQGDGKDGGARKDSDGEDGDERVTSADRTEKGEKTESGIKTETQVAIREATESETIMILEPNIRK